MRHKRAKTYKKLMALYSTSFGFRQPYQVLVDSEICTTATKHKIDLPKQLGVVLQGQVKPMITQCCIHELYLQGKESQPAVDLAKSFERRKCNHREPIPGDDCLTSVIGETNKHRYVVATQLQPLRAKFRSVPAVPLLHIRQTVLVLEPPSDTTLQQKLRDEQSSLAQTTTADSALISSTPSSSSADAPRTRKKGPKAPNPLSVKKKQVKEPPPPKARPPLQEGNVGEKRKRGEDDGQEGGAEGEGATGGRKRKRKRKGGAGAETEGAGGVEEGDAE